MRKSSICDPALRDSGGAAGFEYVDRHSGEPARHPAVDGTSPQPFILKRRKFPQILKAANLFLRVPAQLGREVQPERAPGRGVEMPLDDIAHMAIKLLFRLQDWSSDEAPTALRSKPGRNTSACKREMLHTCHRVLRLGFVFETEATRIAAGL